MVRLSGRCDGGQAAKAATGFAQVAVFFHLLLDNYLIWLSLSVLSDTWHTPCLVHRIAIESGNFLSLWSNRE